MCANPYRNQNVKTWRVTARPCGSLCELNEVVTGDMLPHEARERGIQSMCERYSALFEYNDLVPFASLEEIA